MNIEKILIFRLSSIGDIILTSALVRCVRNKYPDASIDFVVKKQFSQLIKNNPHINNVIDLDTSLGFVGLKQLRKQIQESNYDIFLDIHKNFRSLYCRSFLRKTKVSRYRKNVVKRTLLTSFGIDLYSDELPVYQRFIDAAKLYGVDYDGKKTEFYLSEEDITDFQRIAKENGIDVERKYLVFGPGASFSNKQWPLEYFTILADMLQKHRIQIIIIGGKSEEKFSSEICSGSSNKNLVNLSGKLSLLQSATILKHAGLTVVNDTGMLHLSEALGVPVVGLYGPTSHQLGYYPILENSKGMGIELSCRPCSKMGANSCPKKHFKCMKDLKPEMVYNEIVQRL